MELLARDDVVRPLHPTRPVPKREKEREESSQVIDVVLHTNVSLLLLLAATVITLHCAVYPLMTQYYLCGPPTRFHPPDAAAEVDEVVLSAEGHQVGFRAYRDLDVAEVGVHRSKRVSSLSPRKDKVLGSGVDDASEGVIDGGVTKCASTEMFSSICTETAS